MVALAVAYEVAYRAGLTLHGAVSEYHTSGRGRQSAWRRCLPTAGAQPGADAPCGGHRRYHGPRSQMMRCTDFPTMLRDGVGWGAPSGVMAAYLAELGFTGFTGAPAITVEGASAEPGNAISERLGVSLKIPRTNPIRSVAHIHRSMPRATLCVLASSAQTCFRVWVGGCGSSSPTQTAHR